MSPNYNRPSASENTLIIERVCKLCNLKRLLFRIALSVFITSSIIIWNFTIIHSIRAKESVRDVFFSPRSDARTSVGANFAFKEASSRLLLHNNTHTFLISATLKRTGYENFKHNIFKNADYYFGDLKGTIYAYTGRAQGTSFKSQKAPSGYKAFYRISSGGVRILLNKERLTSARLIGGVTIFSGPSAEKITRHLYARKIRISQGGVALYNFKLQSLNDKQSISGGKTWIGDGASKIIIYGGCKYTGEFKGGTRSVKSDVAVIYLKHRKPHKISFVGGVAVEAGGGVVRGGNASYDLQAERFEISDSPNLKIAEDLEGYSSMSLHNNTYRQSQMNITVY